MRERPGGCQSGWVAGLSVVLALTGCGGDVSSGTNGPGTDGSRAAAVAWEAREVLRIGAVDGPPEATFGRVAALELDGAGNVYVLDAQVPVVRVSDGQGRHLGDLGGPGEGPREFQGPGGLVLGEDRRLWVVDWRLMRYTAFDLGTAGTGGANEPPPRLEGPVATWRREFSAGFRLRRALERLRGRVWASL